MNYCRIGYKLCLNMGDTSDDDHIDEPHSANLILIILHTRHKNISADFVAI